MLPLNLPIWTEWSLILAAPLAWVSPLQEDGKVVWAEVNGHCLIITRDRLRDLSSPTILINVHCQKSRGQLALQWPVITPQGSLRTGRRHDSGAKCPGENSYMSTPNLHPFSFALAFPRGKVLIPPQNNGCKVPSYIPSWPSSPRITEDNPIRLRSFIQPKENFRVIWLNSFVWYMRQEAFKEAVTFHYCSFFPSAAWEEEKHLATKHPGND